MAELPTPLLQVSGLAKRYGGVHALDGAQLSISSAGVVHGLMGANGSGKSTLLGVLSGQVAPDAGRYCLAGAPVAISSAADALRHGIAMVSQETALAPHLSIAENVLLGRRMVRRIGGISWSATRERAAEVLHRLDLDLDPDRLVSTLRPDQQQMVEIARALSMDTKVLILDEPTSSLTEDEVASLFAAMRSLKSEGISMIFVSHRLAELFAIVDELTVLRDGRTVGSGPTSEFDRERLVTLMVGESTDGRDGLAAVAPTVASAVATDSAAPSSSLGSAPVLSVRGLTADRGAVDIDLDVAPGEIVGIAGLVGAGRSELLEAIFGSRPVVAGSMSLSGAPFAPASARDSISSRVGYLPPDRKVAGLVLRRSIAENLAMVSSCDRMRLRSPHTTANRAMVERTMTSMSVRAASADAQVASLSGGNQQKVALGKWLAASPRLMLLDEPTRGVDIAAKAEIYKLLRKAAAGGLAILVSSSENDELLALCDRILVMYAGRVVASVSSHLADVSMIGRYASGHLEP